MVINKLKLFLIQTEMEITYDSNVTTKNPIQYVIIVILIVVVIFISYLVYKKVMSKNDF